MIKISTYLAAFALMALATTAGRAAVISPVNDNAAVKIVLPLPADQYMPFSLKLSGQAVTIGKDIAIDSGSKCLRFETLVIDLKMQYFTEFCGNFAKGTTTEIQMPSIRFVGDMKFPDAVFGNGLFNYTFYDKAGASVVTFPRELTDFEFPKLMPYLMNSTTVSVKMPREVAKVLAVDANTKVIEFVNPAKAMHETVFTRAGTKSFPDAAPLTLRLQRGAEDYEPTLPAWRTESLQIDKDVITIHWNKMPWSKPDRLNILQNGICYMNTCNVPLQTGGFDTAGIAIASTVPTKVNVHRIDVDDVVVNSADGQSKRVKGSYSIKYQTNEIVLQDAKTPSGMDVLPGKYDVVVNYVDPFTGVAESKSFKLDFK